MLGFAYNIKAQVEERFFQSGDLSLVGKTDVGIGFVNKARRHVNNPKFWVSLDLGARVYDNGPLSRAGSELQITFRLVAFKGSIQMDDVFGGQELILKISENEPESFFIRNLNPFVGNSVDSEPAFDRVEVTIIGSNISVLSSSDRKLIRLKWNYSENYGLKCDDIQPVNTSVLNADLPGHDMRFQWQDNQLFDGKYYQLQILKLFNESETNANDESNIQATIHWQNAGTYIVTPSAIGDFGSKSVDFAVSEGTGFYAWRVRPVSDYFGGGIGNPANFGLWSNGPSEGENLALSKSNNLSEGIFYFIDKEEGRNYSYQRVFTEQGQNKELVTYANRLNQVRQTATYLPSENVSIVTQTIMDHTGRPALVTMPVPVSGKNLEYREGLVKTESGQLYTADQFDDDKNFRNPEAFDETGLFSYYHNNSEGVANSQGYPYARTLFYNDGSGRVKEQGGVGLEHRLHSDSQSGVHTNRYIYESATQTELYGFFGDEAPNAENVFKTVTIDPNGIATVTYTNKEGQVLATGLSFTKEEVTALVEIDDAKYQQLEVTNLVTNNLKTERGFVSTKRINITNSDSPNLSISYRVRLNEIQQLCVNTNFDCHYQLKLSVYKINDDGTTAIVESKDFLELEDRVIEDEKYKIANHTVVLPSEGVYIVEKELIPQGLSQQVTKRTEVVDEQVSPLTTYLSGMLENVETREQLYEFFEQLNEISSSFSANRFDNYVLSASSDLLVGVEEITGQWLNEVYSPRASGFSLDLLPRNRTDNFITEMVLSTPCCQNMVIPVNWVPPFDGDNDDNKNGKLDIEEKKDRNQNGVINRYDTPDFEKAMIEMLYDCIEDGKLDEFYKKYMSGWDQGASIDVFINESGALTINSVPGVFNEMIYHMINDQYRVDSKGDAVVQYKCEELYDCWKTTIIQLKQMMGRCTSTGLDYAMNNQEESVSDAYGDEYTEDKSEDKYSKDHDNHFDSSIKGGWFLTRWIAKRKISKRMRNLQVGSEENMTADVSPELPEFHLVQSFLECAGIKYAKILTPFDANPLADDICPGFVYSYEPLSTSEYDAQTAPVSLKYRNVEQDAYIQTLTPNIYLKSDKSHFFVPLITEGGTSWGPMDEKTNKPYFPYVRNPIYAFKYFYYDMMGALNYQQLENSVCFSDPNDCFDSKLVNGLYYYKVNQIVNPVSGSVTWDRISYPCCLTVAKGGDPSAVNPSDCKLCMEDAAYYGVGKPAKWIVREFTEMGRVRCPVSYRDWSAYQRLSFFNTLKNFVIPSADQEWSEISSITIEDYTNPRKWYTNPDMDQFPLVDYLLTEEMITAKGYDPSKFSPITAPSEITNGEGKYIMVEKEMYELKLECLGECERKRSDFKQKLYTMLNARCYVIGGCRTNDPSTWNVIPEEDLEMMINAMVDHCKEQCQLNTYSAESTESRDLQTPNILFGAKNQSGDDQFTVKIQYGMGGHPDANAHGYQDGQTPFATVLPNGLVKYQFDTDGDSYPEEWRPSWYQYTALKQVKEWDFEITLPSKCADHGNVEPDWPSEQSGDSPNNHHVERDDYEINPVGIPDRNEPKLNTPLLSPSVILQLGVGASYDKNGKPLKP